MMKTQDEKSLTLVQFSGTLMGDTYWPSVSSNAHDIKAIKATSEPNETHVFYAKTDHFTRSGEEPNVVYSCFGTMYQNDSKPVQEGVLQLDVTGPSDEHPTGQARWSVAGTVYQDWLDFLQEVVIKTEE